jgi:hypothetical protein
VRLVVWTSVIISPVRALRAFVVLGAISLGLLGLRVSTANATTSVLSPSPAAKDFGNADIHSGGGPTQTFTFTNNTAGNVNVSTDMVVGANPSDFQLSANTCPSAFLGPTGSCSVQLTFHPTSVGAASASLELTDDSGTLDVPMSRCPGSGSRGSSAQRPTQSISRHSRRQAEPSS